MSLILRVLLEVPYATEEDREAVVDLLEKELPPDIGYYAIRILEVK